MVRGEAKVDVKARIRIHFPMGFIGPGKIDLLEKVDEYGSISAAGRAMDMSYRRAWQLIDAMNQTFCEPVVAAQTGGKKGGGAEVTDFGRQLIVDYRTCEKKFLEAAAAELQRLERSAKRNGEGCFEK